VKYPAETDFDVSIEESGVWVTFKPTASSYSFYRLADAEDIERHGPLSLSNVRHDGPSGDTADYISSEVQEMAVRLARSALVHNRGNAA
jgi:hypothetical protein